MIAKAVKGRGFRGALAYDLGKDEGRILDTNMAGEGVSELSSEFGAVRKLRPNLERAVLHVSLSAAPGEKLTDHQWQLIARRYLDGMALNDNQYIVTRHTDTEHEHVHILANRITPAGKVVSDSQDYSRQEALMRGIEREFGLRPLAPSRDAERRAATRGEIEKHIRTDVVSTRIQLQRLADVASKDCASFSEYRERLRAVGVELEPILQQEGAKLTGLMYRLDGVTMKGSDLGKGYSPAGLAKRGVSYERSRDAAASLEVAKKTKPKRVRPSRAQTLPKLELSGLETFAKEQDARDRSQAALKEILAEAERAKAFLAQERLDRELRAREQRLAAIAWAYEEIEHQARERDLRVRDVLAQAEQRQARRDANLSRVAAARPEPPQGLLAAFKEKSHRQALAAWEQTWQLVTKLSDEAAQLAKRLARLVHPREIKHWAQELVRRARPQSVAWLEQEQQAKARTAAEAAARDEQQRRAEPRVQPPALSPREVRQAELQRAAAHSRPLLEKSKESLGLTLAEKQQLGAAWDAMAELHDEGYQRNFTEAQRHTLERLRQQSRRQIVADRFLNTPRAEALGHHPELAGHYAVLEAIDRHSEQRGLTGLERARERELAHKRLAVAIEEGQGMRFEGGRLEVHPEPAASELETQQDRRIQTATRPRER